MVNQHHGQVSGTDKGIIVTGRAEDFSFPASQRKAKKHLPQRTLRLCGEKYKSFQGKIQATLLRCLLTVNVSKKHKKETWI
jgi:hypothetical protein